jgi:hypothetical protein
MCKNPNICLQVFLLPYKNKGKIELTGIIRYAIIRTQGDAKTACDTACEE